MELKEYDNQLMELAYEIRQCKEIAGKITSSCPDHMRRMSQSLGSNMQHAELIIGQVRAMLMESRLLLEQQYRNLCSEE